MKNLIRKILKESEDDGLDWIDDVPSTILIEPNSFYIFNPPLSGDEILYFTDKIGHTFPEFKQYLRSINRSVIRGSQVSKMFYIFSDENSFPAGWGLFNPSDDETLQDKINRIVNSIKVNGDTIKIINGRELFN